METKKVQYLLAHSYLFYFFMFLLGILLDLKFPTNFFQSLNAQILGLVLLFLSSALILWAQVTSKNLKKDNLTKETFCRGPYCFTRTPTHWGLFFLMIGFGIIANAFFVIVLTIVSFFVTKFVFLNKQEAVLAKRYGEPYLEYKKSVRF